jgi:uncharacterized membrane protein YdbT with pleckstrin-like domain
VAQRMSFELHEGEEVILFERRHPAVLAGWLIPPVLLLVALGTAAWVLTQWPDWSQGARFMIWLIGLLPALGWITWRVFDWENDHYVLTNQRVLHIEKIYFVYESCVEASLDRVQDVRVQMPSFMANLFYYGNVEVETAGATGRIVFSAIAKPRKVQRLIFDWAGLSPQHPETEIEEGQPERWAADAPRWRRPHQMLVRMFFATLPTNGDNIVWRKHWWILFKRMLGPLLVALTFLAITVLWVQLALLRQGQIIWLLGFVAALLWAVWQAIDWRNDLYIMTPDRLIDIEKRPFVFEDRLEAGLSMIQDVRYTQPSFASMLLDFGDVHLQTAGEQGSLTFDSVPHPKRVQATITDRVRRFRENLKRSELERQRQEMRGLVEDILGEQSAGSG